MKKLYPFLNPVEWIKAAKYAKKNSKFEKSKYDLELFLYSKILTNNMLHYGYFDDPDTRPESVSFEQVEEAQMKYAYNIVNQISDKENPVLDVGCGMGGLSELLHNNGYNVESLTPNNNQIEFIKKNYKHLIPHKCKFEKFETNKKFGTVINSESLQYISLDEAFDKVNEITLPKGRWIIVDYFRIIEGKKKKPHNLDTFYKKVKESDWSIIYERDISPNILPTLKFVDMYVKRFLYPFKHYAYEKLRFKKPKLYYLSDKIRKSIDKKIEKEMRNVDPSIFAKERKYMFFVLDKNKSF